MKKEVEKEMRTHSMIERHKFLKEILLKNNIDNKFFTYTTEIETMFIDRNNDKKNLSVIKDGFKSYIEEHIYSYNAMLKGNDKKMNIYKLYGIKNNKVYEFSYQKKLVLDDEIVYKKEIVFKNSIKKFDYLVLFNLKDEIIKILIMKYI